ncbi:MAG: leucine-rich repeat protein [Treponema sp.]|nr:leucine-rich repeat protein [Treponema sp.]
MKTMQRIIVGVLMAAMVTITGCGGKEKVKPETYYKVRLKDGGVIITGYTGPGSNETIGKAVIPGKFSGKTVTAIGDGAFTRCDGLTSVSIPRKVTSIGSRAFAGCTGLSSVKVPNSVTVIGDYAFSGCDWLSAVSIGSGVTSIEAGAFSKCTKLSSVSIGKSVTKIGNSAFSECTGLVSLVIPDSVTSIERGAFNGCTGLVSITIPASVTGIERGAFNGCSGLTSVVFAEGSSIARENFGAGVFPELEGWGGDTLKKAYLAGAAAGGAAGTYTRDANGKTWTKQGGTAEPSAPLSVPTPAGTKVGNYTALRLVSQDAVAFTVDSGGNNLDIRDIPNGNVVFQVSHNDTVYGSEVTQEKDTFENKTDRWVKVSTSDGRSGWVFGGFLSAVNPGARYPGVE